MELRIESWLVVDYNWITACVQTNTLLGPRGWGNYYLGPGTPHHLGIATAPLSPMAPNPPERGSQQVPHQGHVLRHYSKNGTCSFIQLSAGKVYLYYFLAAPAVQGAEAAVSGNPEEFTVAASFNHKQRIQHRGGSHANLNTDNSSSASCESSLG